MEFCTITPTAGLERWGTALSRRHLVLAQQLYNKEYMQYYADRKAAGDFLILDNGAYENTRPLDSDAYFNFIKGLNPDVAILPDILMSPWRETTSAALRFLDTYAGRLEDHGYRTQWMFVPQCTQIQDWLKGLECVVNDGRVGKYVKWVGLGRYLSTNLGADTRIHMARHTREGYPELRLHALGMAAGNLDELKALRDAGVESIDSSAPVWRGWNGFGLNDPPQDWAQRGTPCDFSAPMHDRNHDTLIAENLEVIRKCLL